MSVKENEVETTQEKKPGIIVKFIALGLLPFTYSIFLVSVILHFSVMDFSDQKKWVEHQTKPLLEKVKSQIEAKNETEKPKTGEVASPSQAVSSQSPTDNQKEEGSETSTSEDTVAQGSESTEEAPAFAESLAMMEPKKAAKLMNNMSEQDALEHLKQLDADAQTAIISEMDPAAAARFTVALVTGKRFPSTTESSLQLYEHMEPKQIASILNRIDNHQVVLRQIKQLDPKTAAQVISQLDPEIAGWIITQMN